MSDCACGTCACRDPKGTEREILALGHLSAELAHRADAWNGNAPKWFPEPPEWLTLWEKALKETEDLLDNVHAA